MNRRGAIDVARIAALAVVVFGHLLMAVVDRAASGAVRGTNLLALHPGWSPIAMVAPMPVFFAAAGWANAPVGVARSIVRLRTLLGLAAACVAGWSVAVLTMWAITGRAGVVGAGARLATQPLWFLAAYLPLTLLARPVAAAVHRRPVVVFGTAFAVLGALDLWRFGAHGPGWPAWIGFFVAWGVPWALGSWWRDRCETGAFAERRVGAAWMLVGGLAAWLLVARFGYQASLIDYGSDGRSNTNPPTLYTAVVALVQVGGLLCIARGLDAVATRRRTLIDRLGGAAVAVYVWHLSALALVVAVSTAVGVVLVRRDTVLWWLTRPLWWGAVLAVCVGFVAATAAVRQRFAVGDESRGAADAGNTLGRRFLGVLVGAVGAGFVGLQGPGSPGRAVICTALLGGGWLLARG